MFRKLLVITLCLFAGSVSAQESSTTCPEGYICTRSETDSVVDSNSTTTVYSPPSTAVAPTINGSTTDSCTVGVAGAVQTQILGLSAGKTVRDINCERLKNAKTLYDMGMKVAAVSTTSDNKTVRWTANININVNKVTNSKIRFYNQPLIEVEPILSYAVSSSVENNPKTVTGSFISTPVQPKADFDIQKFGYRKNLVDYRIIDGSANFSSSLKNFQVQLYVNKIRDYASLNEISINTTASFLIKDVLNVTTLILDTPFTYNNKIAVITSGNYKIVSDMTNPPDEGPYFTFKEYRVTFASKGDAETEWISRASPEDIERFKSSGLRKRPYPGMSFTAFPIDRAGAQEAKARLLEEVIIDNWIIDTYYIPSGYLWYQQFCFRPSHEILCGGCQPQYLHILRRLSTSLYRSQMPSDILWCGSSSLVNPTVINERGVWQQFIYRLDYSLPILVVVISRDVASLLNFG